MSETQPIIDPKLYAALTITELILKYGVPAALAMISRWEISDPTVEDWESLKLQAAEEYFK